MESVFAGAARASQGNAKLPLIYEELDALVVMLAAPSRLLKPLLPSPKLALQKVTPWHALCTLSVFDYRKCDLAPYKEAGFSIPVAAIIMKAMA